MNPIFKSNDNREFDTEEAAEKHNKFLKFVKRVSSTSTLYSVVFNRTFRESGYPTQYRNWFTPVLMFGELKEDALFSVNKDDQEELLERLKNLELYDTIENIDGRDYNFSYYYKITIQRIR